MKTNDLINALAQDATVRWPLVRTFGMAVAAGAVIAGMLFFPMFGFRSDIAHALETARFLFKFVVTLTLAGTAAGMVLRLARPGVPVGRWGWALAAAPILLMGAVVAELLVMPESTWSARLVGHNAWVCVTVIPFLSIGPLACLLLALRQGAPGRPGIAGAMAGLAASGIAATFYASNCTDDSPLFVFAWYPMATAIVVVIGYLAGSRLLRW